jgi:hypothetical protein
LKKRKGNFSCNDLSSLFLAARHFLELGTHTWNGANLIPKNLKATKKRLEFLHDKKVSDMTGGEIDECFNGSSATYCNAMLRETRSVFNWCMGCTRKWQESNPADGCEFSTLGKIGEVQIYTLEQAMKVMEAGVLKHPEIVPALAMMLFAGIRPDQEDCQEV